MVTRFLVSVIAALVLAVVALLVAGALFVKGSLDLGDGVLARVVETLLIRPRDALVYISPADQFAGNSDTSRRTAIPCPEQGPSTAVFFTFGQSNAGNVAPTRNIGLPGVSNFNFFDGKCYAAVDPLLGATGDGGSIWTLLGSRLIAEGIFDNVVLVAAALGGSSINRWSNPRDLGERIAWAAREMATQKIVATHVLFIQGEADQRPSPEYSRLRPSEFVKFGPDEGYSMRTGAYIAHFEAVVDILHQSSIGGPIFVAIRTRCGDSEQHVEGPISRAQREIPQILIDAKPGPDLNALPPAAYDGGCHFSDAGVSLAAQGWLNVIRETK